MLISNLPAATQDAINLYNKAHKETDDTKKVSLLLKALKNTKRKDILAKIHNSLGLAYRRLINHEKSAYHFTKAINYNPKDYNYRANRCYLYTLMEKYDSALKDCEKTLKLGGKRSRDYNALGLVYQKLGKQESAETFFKTAIIKSPENCFYHYNLGDSYYLMKDYDKSVGSFDVALKLCTRYSKAYAKRGEAFYKLEEYEEAFTDFKYAVKWEPENIDYYKYKIYSLISLGECGKALKDILKLLRIAKDDPESYLTFALYWTCKGNTEFNNEKALKNISLAENLGYRDFLRLKTDEPYKTFFSFIRELPEYRKLENISSKP